MPILFSHTTKQLQSQRGVSLVEVIIVAALITLIFGGLFAGVQLMLEIVGHSKAQAGARSLAVSKMEYIRSLPYDSVGTLAGIPSGTIAQNSTTTLNGLTYNERVLIQYLDRPADGFGVSDDNGITEDSKIIKLEYTWNIRGENKSLTLTSDIIPAGIESTAGGGTLLINVFDAEVAPVAGASIRVYNDTVATDTIDVTVTTNANGIANFPGAPARSGYQITASKVGYSTDQTYSASSTNPSPNPPHISVAVGAVSTVNFAIDELSDLTIRAIGPPVASIFNDSFTSDALLFSTTSTDVSGGSLVLDGGSGSYDVLGTALSTSSEPTTISSWQSFDFDGTNSSDTEFRVRLYSVTGSGATATYTLVPDTDLSDNSIGFINGPIDITGVAVGTYPALALGATLTTTNSSQTPQLDSWQLTHIESEAPVGGVAVSTVSDKAIGTNGGMSVPKYTNVATTNSSGEIVLTDLEWDSYDIAIDGVVEGYDIAESYAALPYTLLPGVNEALTLVLEPHAAYSLRVSVTDTLGSSIAGATTHIHNGTVDQTQDTSIYGQTFFSSGMASATDYTLDVSAPGYEPDSLADIAITGTTELGVVLALESGPGDPDPPDPPVTYLAGYTNRVPISISGSSLFGSVTDFPVYFNMADLPSSVFASIQSNGDDIRITESNGVSEVPREVVWVDTGNNTGEMYFKASSLDISTTTKFYFYYGSTTASGYANAATYGRNNVWSNGYQAVYHLQEDPSGTAPQMADSSGNGHDTTAEGSMTSGDSVSGPIGAAIDFDGIDDALRDSSWSWGGDEVTITFWNQVATADVTTGAAFGFNRSGTIFFSSYAPWSNSRIYFDYGDTSVGGRILTNYTSYFDAWTHIALVSSGSGNSFKGIYLNSSLATSDTTSEMPSVTLSNFILGGSNSRRHDGQLDEFRFADVMRSSGWIGNQYSNQNNPNGFYSVGSIETE